MSLHHRQTHRRWGSRGYRWVGLGLLTLVTLLGCWLWQGNRLSLGSTRSAP
ncbi:MAG: hypothetical protein HC812_02245 [Leptolyngbya sp. RL_3_1]|nr:hypothetical protein [Leptolyngbya sp. RL_3_1]